MKIKRLSLKLALAACLATLATSVFAIPSMTTIPAIGGSGISDQWYASTEGNVTLAIAAHERTTGAQNTDGNGNFYFPLSAGPLASWNFDFLVKATPNLLANYDYMLALTGSGIAGFSVNMLLFPDNAYGTESTPNGGGSVGLASTYAATSTVMMNSENIGFSFIGADPSAIGIYELTLTASPKIVANFSANSPAVAPFQNKVTINNGTPMPTQTVPDTGSTAGLLACGLGFLIPVSMLRKKHLAKTGS